MASALSVAAGIAAFGIHQSNAAIQRTAQAAEAGMVEIEEDLRIRPADYSTALERYQAILGRLQGAAHTDRRARISERCRELRKSRELHIDSVIRSLRAEAHPYLEERQFAKAAEILRSYDGVLAEETKDDREKMADQFAEQARRHR